MANKALLTIALNNIIGNAYKFSNNDMVICDLDAGSNYIRITISDFGIGIPGDETEKIFQSFYRASNVKNFYGTGVGLYITGKIINLFNGNITAKPNDNKGTSMIIEFNG